MSACINDKQDHRPASDEVNVHFRIHMPKPTHVDSRAVENPEVMVVRLALLVFQQENGTGEFLYRYTAVGQYISQDTDTEADFRATLRATNEPVKLMAIIGYNDGLLNNIAENDTESEVRNTLTGNVNSLSYGMPMSGVKELDNISADMGTLRIPTIRSVAKVTIDKADQVDNFTFTSVRIYRAINEFQYFPDLGAVLNEDGSEGTPIANAVSIPETTTPWLTVQTPVSQESYLNFFPESAANNVVGEAMCIVAGGFYNGSETETFYRLDFETDIDAPVYNAMGQILRNFWYQFIITEVTGPGWSTPEDAANNSASTLMATVMPWNGGDNSEYHFGKDRYVILSEPELVLGTTIGDKDELYITTSGVPFTIASQGIPAAGLLSTADDGLKVISTNVMDVSMEAVLTGVQPGQERWLLTVTAETTDLIGDVLNLNVLGGLMTIRIPVRRDVEFSVERIGELETVPNTGTPDRKTGNYTHYVEYQIIIPESMTWSATITDQGWVSGIPTESHPAYLIDPATGQPAGTTVSGQGSTTTLRVGFDQLFYPTLNESPKATIVVSLDDVENQQQIITVVQDPLPVLSQSLDILDVYSTGYGSLRTGSALTRYTQWLEEPRLYGTSGYMQTSAPLTFTYLTTSTSGIPAAIDPKFRYIHVGGYPATSYTQARHDIVNSYWQQYGNDRIFVYAIDEVTNSIFANADEGSSKRTTVLSMLDINYRATSGAGTSRLITTDPEAQASAIFRYLTQDGPFGPTPDFANFTFYYDGISTGVNVSSLPETAVPIFFDNRGIAGGCVMFFIDPANGVVYWGDSQFFDTGIPAYLTASSMVTAMGNGTAATYNRFFGNFIAYIVNCAQYGSGFAGLFLPGNEALYDKAFPPAP